MRQGIRRTLTVLVTLLALAACDPETGRDFTLYTHCGIEDLQFEGQ
jgi:hypothetical protein